jgi:hypothetical protein
MTLILPGEEEMSMFAMMIMTNQIDPMSDHQAPDHQTLAVPQTVLQDLYIDPLKDRRGAGKKNFST